MIHEDAGESVADSAVEEYGSHAAVDASGEAEDNAVVAQLSLQFCYSGVYEGRGAPVLVAAADVDHKVLQ